MSFAEQFEDGKEVKFFKDTRFPKFTGQYLNKKFDIKTFSNYIILTLLPTGEAFWPSPSDWQPEIWNPFT